MHSDSQKIWRQLYNISILSLNDGQCNLDSGQRVEDVRVVAVHGAEAAGVWVLALGDELHDLVPLHQLEAVHEVHGGHAPVEAVHAEELGHGVLVLVRVVPVLENETLVQIQSERLLSIFWYYSIFFN